MAKQLIDAVNDILIRTDNLDTDNRLSTLSDSARQNAIDVAIQVINEEITQLYDLAEKDFPTEQAQDLKATDPLRIGDFARVCHCRSAANAAPGLLDLIFSSGGSAERLHGNREKSTPREGTENHCQIKNR